MRQAVCITLVSFALSACAFLPESVTGRSTMSSLSAPESFQALQPEKSRIIGGLLDVFGDATLHTLVEHALDHNLDIQLAAQRMEEAGFQARAEWGTLLPKFSGKMATNRKQDSTGTLTGTYTPSLDVSWEVDIWGKLRNRKAARDATTQARLENFQAIQNSIAAQVIQSWFDTVTAEKQVRLEQARLANLQKSAENNRRNYEAGLGQLDDLDAVNRDIAQSTATLAARTNTRNTAIRTLQVLTGQYPDGNIDLDYQLPALLSAPAAGVPADLLTERPDLRRAWQEVLSADKSVKVAHRAMFPTLSLTGSLGTQSRSFSDLMSGATIWSLANNLTLPLFNAFELANTMKATQSRAEQAWLAYLQTALNAFQEVEQALDRETWLDRQEHAQQKAVTHAENTARIFEERYKNGLVSILEYLAAQNTVFDMRGQLLNVRNQRLKNRIALALALGKGV